MPTYDENLFPFEYVTIEPEAMALLRAAFVEWDDCETGAPAINPKRPYGNSDVPGDVARILGWPMEGDDGWGPCLSRVQRERAYALHRSTGTALAVVLASGTFEPGRYRRQKYVGRWERA